MPSKDMLIEEFLKSLEKYAQELSQVPVRPTKGYENVYLYGYAVGETNTKRAIGFKIESMIQAFKQS